MKAKTPWLNPYPSSLKPPEASTTLAPLSTGRCDHLSSSRNQSLGHHPAIAAAATSVSAATSSTTSIATSSAAIIVAIPSSAASIRATATTTISTTTTSTAVSTTSLTTPPPPPPRDWAWLTVMFLPSSSFPFISLMAADMDCSSAKVTKPNPRDRPVSRSAMTLLWITSPKGLKASSRRPSVVAHARPPTKHLNSDSPMMIEKASETSNPNWVSDKVTKKPKNREALGGSRETSVTKEKVPGKENEELRTQKGGSRTYERDDGYGPNPTHRGTTGPCLHPTVPAQNIHKQLTSHPYVAPAAPSAD